MLGLAKVKKDLVKIMRANEFLFEKWSDKYKRSIDCSNPKGFSQKAHCAGKKNESTLNEYRNALYDFVKSKFPTWPEYVLKDFLYAQAKGIRDQEELNDFLERNQKDLGQVKWRLEKLPITLDIFTPKTQRMIKQREGGSSNPYQVPKDAERHAQQLKMIQQQGVRTEPIIVAKLNNGYDLIEGWHRTIQHLQQYPEGYTGPAWVAYDATYTSESKQGVKENLRAWFGKGKKGGAGGGGWDRYNTKGERIGKCGDAKKSEGKPKCLSKSRAASLRAKGGKKAIAAAVNKKRRDDPNKNRRGKAKNVSNTVKTRKKK